MGWLQLVGSLQLYFSYAKEPYKRDDILQKTYDFKEPTDRSHPISKRQHTLTHTHTQTCTHNQTHTHTHTQTHTRRHTPARRAFKFTLHRPK